MFTKLVATGLFALTPVLGLAADARTLEDRHAQIDSHLVSIQEETRQERYLAGGLSLGMGLVMGGIAIDKRNTDSHLTTAFGISGGLLTATGALLLFIPSDQETLPEEFFALPETSPLGARVSRGENILEALAINAKQNRTYGGALLITLGAVNGILGLTGKNYSSAEKAALISSGVVIASIGGLTLKIPSEAEVQLSSYKSWLAGQPEEQEEASAHIKNSLIAAYGGLGIQSTFSF